MLDIIFFSRRSNHAKYFKKVSQFISLSSEVHVTGSLYFVSLNAFKAALDFNTHQITAKQILRKKASNPNHLVALAGEIIAKFIAYKSTSPGN